MKSMNNKGFRIYAITDRAAYDDAAATITQFAEVFGRKVRIKDILVDEVITAAEIREELLDRNRDGYLEAGDFRRGRDWLPFGDKKRPAEAFLRLAALFSDHGENLCEHIANYQNYRPQDIFYPAFYLAPPAAFRADPDFMLGAIRFDARAYRYADKALKEGYGFNPDFFNQSARAANPEVEKYIP